MDVIEKKLKDIKPYEKNPRKNDNAIDAVASSISQFGFKNPIVVDGNNVIICGHTRYKAAKKLGLDSVPCVVASDLTEEQILLNGNTPDLIYTDPPYGMNAVSKSGVLSENYKTDILGDDDNTVAIDAFNLSMQMFKDVKAVWWGANYYTECLPSSECWIVWDKNNGASDQTDCELAWSNFRSVVRQFTMASEKKNRVHPTQKPCDLFAQVVKKFDKNKEFNKVLDLFGGSGSTLIACEQLNRNCFMMELDPHYVDVIIARWEKFTGQKAVLLNGND